MPDKHTLFHRFLLLRQNTVPAKVKYPLNYIMKFICFSPNSKPYNAQVLLARIQKLLLRNGRAQEGVVLTHKGLTLNLLKAEIVFHQQTQNSHFILCKFLILAVMADLRL